MLLKDERLKPEGEESTCLTYTSRMFVIKSIKRELKTRKSVENTSLCLLLIDKERVKDKTYI
jgi:hypothetical protein